MSPFVRQGVLEVGVFTGLILMAQAAVSLAGGEGLHWYLIPVYVLAVAVRTIWRMHRHRRAVSARE